MYSFILNVQVLIKINAIIFYLAIQVLDYQRNYFAAVTTATPISTPTPNLKAVV